MKELHPEIKKYWERKGYSIETENSGGVIWWKAIGHPYLYIALGSLDGKIIIYYSENLETYNEKRMLRHIKLEAFI